MKILWIKIVIFNRIGRLEYNSIFKAFNMPQRLKLNLQREGGGETLKVVLRRINAFWLQEKLVGVFIGKSAKFVFNGRTVPGALSVNHSGEQGRPVKTGFQDFVNGLISVKEKTIHLRLT